ncbi:MAG TPA: histidine phosphatase family protein [Vicinamibacterales bacterium]|nr:histidine phosphatase family protein [Vicinamibacterales bacterium]
MIIFILALLAAQAAAPVQTAAGVTTVVIVRHAEAVPDSGPDPVLSEAGAARANALAEALADAGVKAVITTQYQRTALTGGPLAAALNVPLIKESIAGGPAGFEAYARNAVQTVRTKYAGGTVVIVGHSNTVPALVKAFSGVDVGEIAHDSYDRMFVVTLGADGSGSVVRARYGAR